MFESKNTPNKKQTNQEKIITRKFLMECKTKVDEKHTIATRQHRTTSDIARMQANELEITMQKHANIVLNEQKNETHKENATRIVSPVDK